MNRFIQFIKSKRRVRNVILIVLMVLPLFTTSVSLAKNQANAELRIVELSIKGNKLKAEVAADNTTRTLGLMNRFSLKPAYGMVFVFTRSEPLAFWMKNTFIPLSIAYIDNHGKIVSMADMKPQDETAHPSTVPAQYALEMKQGWFKARGIVVGDRVEGLDKAGRAKN